MILWNEQLLAQMDSCELVHVIENLLECVMEEGCLYSSKDSIQVSLDKNKFALPDWRYQSDNNTFEVFRGYAHDPNKSVEISISSIVYRNSNIVLNFYSGSTVGCFGWMEFKCTDGIKLYDKEISRYVD